MPHVPEVFAPDDKSKEADAHVGPERLLANVGKPGETIEIRNGHLLINGERLEEPLVIKGITYYNNPEWKYGKAGRPVKIPPGNYFFLGDNSLSSADSRKWGFVPRRNLVGNVFLIHWPIRRIRVIK